MAQKFARLGANKIVLLDLNSDLLKTAQAAVERALAEPSRQEVHTIVADLSKAATAKPAMQEIINKVGDITILINNAGVVTGKKFNECPGPVPARIKSQVLPLTLTLTNAQIT